MMLCPTLCRTPAPVARFLPRHRCLASAARFLPRHRCLASAAGVRMSQYVEHVVLFNVKEDTDASKVDTMVSSLSSLRSLDVAVHLTAGPIHRLRSLPPPRFTHMLHSRYRTKDDLATYSAHPDHLSCVRQHVLPICDDLMAVDWISPELSGDSSPSPGSAMRLQLVKLKEGAGDEEKEKVIRVIAGLKDKIGSVNEITFGENFSPARAKGFSICSIGFFPSLAELEKLEGDEAIDKEKEKVRDLIDGLIVADCLLPSVQSAAANL